MSGRQTIAAGAVLLASCLTADYPGNGYEAGSASEETNAGDTASGATDPSRSLEGTLDSDSGQPPVEPIDAEPLIFSVMGDVPYTLGAKLGLELQIAEHNAMSPSRFMVHVGDIMSGPSTCPEQTYIDVAAQLHQLQVPTFVLPGDNEWNDCGNPDLAWKNWQTHLSEFETYWRDAPQVERQELRPENFAWMEERVLVVGINLVGGAVHDADEWQIRMQQDADWVDEKLREHGDEAYAMVLLGHAHIRSQHETFSAQFRVSAAAFGKPVVYIHGDGHTWIDDFPWPERNIRRIQVDDGNRAPPIQVTVWPDTPAEPFEFHRSPY